MKKLFFTLGIMTTSLFGYSQTIYVPSGTDGIGVSSTARVGIGTSAPIGLLDVAKLPGQYQKPFVLSDGSGNLNVLFEYPSTGLNYLTMYMRDNSNVNKVSISPTGNSYFNGGNIGFGTTSPLGKVDILSVTDGVALRLSMPTSEDASAYDIKWSNSNADVVHRIQFASTYYDFMNVNRATRNISFNGGNVGIGTANPQSKLAVNGLITSKEVKVTLDGWSDFVFNKEYKLKSLEQVETYIEENNHLPDVPSEKEVLENGIQLGVMDATLLQKIEELTLYMIDLNKRVNSLEEENKILKEENSILKTQ